MIFFMYYMGFTFTDAEQAEKARIQDAYGGAARICDGVLVT